MGHQSMALHRQWLESQPDTTRYYDRCYSPGSYSVQKRRDSKRSDRLRATVHADMPLPAPAQTRAAGTIGQSAASRSVPMQWSTRNRWLACARRPLRYQAASGTSNSRRDQCTASARSSSPMQSHENSSIIGRCGGEPSEPCVGAAAEAELRMPSASPPTTASAAAPRFGSPRRTEQVRGAA